MVGRDGRAYRADEWRRSRTYWSGDQENPLVADDQMARYADPADRADFTSAALGSAAAGPAVAGR